MFWGCSNIVKLNYNPRNIITFVNTSINIYKSLNYIYFKHEKGCSLHARTDTHTLKKGGAIEVFATLTGLHYAQFGNKPS
jgi:hypothetical protein